MYSCCKEEGPLHNGVLYYNIRVICYRTESYLTFFAEESLIEYKVKYADGPYEAIDEEYSWENPRGLLYNI
jgi:hypothetical protein